MNFKKIVWKIEFFIKKIIWSIGFDIRRNNFFPVDHSFMRQFTYLSKLYSGIKNIDGDVVECGVGKGKTFFMLSFLLETEGRKRNLWGFDSFEGFPEPSREDTSYRNPKKGEWSGTSTHDIVSILKRGKINESFIKNNVKFAVGFFEDTLSDFKPPKIALLHIDVDLYASYKIVLEKLFPYVQEGGVVLFDEYNLDKWPGATKAINEYFNGMGYDIRYDKSAKKFFLVK